MIYINGELVIQESLTGTIAVNDVPLSIGANNIGHREFFDGLLDEVRIWNVARTQEQIQSAMNTTLTGSEEGLVAYWNFDDGTADDLSQYGNNGTLQGDATIVDSELSTVIFIPDDYPTIQAGIDAANPGDAVVVDAGTYNENVVVSKDGISLQGSGADVTTIDGGDAGSVIKMSGVSDVTISGFTITNGLGDGQDYYFNDNGGGIAVYECSNITIRDNVITQNQATGSNADGGGILVAKCTDEITIWQNTITDNNAQHWGGGISIQGSSDVRIDWNDISNNDAGVGDGISLWEGAPADGASAWIIN